MKNVTFLRVFLSYNVYDHCVLRKYVLEARVLIAIGCSTKYTRCTLHITGALSDYSTYIIKIHIVPS